MKSEPEEIELPIDSHDNPTNFAEELLNSNSLKQKSKHTALFK